MPTEGFLPVYLSLAAGEFDRRIAQAYARLRACDLCPRCCGADRTAGETGFCGAGSLPKVSSYGPHFGEEPPLVGRFGSGTVFLTGCNLGCCFCQNYDISHGHQGREVEVDLVARATIGLQEIGCHNINFVTPTHFAPQIMAAVRRAASGGLRLPVVYNCGGYESLETLRLLDGIVDIYMPDYKFAGSQSARRYCNAPDYPQVARAALKEMHRQVGELVIQEGIARRGLLVRHLVMPGHLEDSVKVFRFLAEEISPDTFVNVMEQYRPCHRADQYPEIARRLEADEHRAALEAAKRAGLRRIHH